MHDAEPNLDILRALAVLMVLADHVTEMLALQNAALSIHPYNLILGRLGVLLFFVHTALVLNHSMARAGLTDWNDIKSFYIRRAFRIYPLAIATVALVVALNIPTMPWREYNASLTSIVTSLTLTSNLLYAEPVLQPMWSLPIEVQMYIALPIIYLIVRKRPSWVLALWLLSLPVAWLQPTYLGRFSVFAFVPCFLGGILAFTLADRAKFKLPGWMWLPTLLLISAAYLVLQRQSIHFPPTQWLTCLLVGAIIPSFAHSTAARLNAAGAFIAKYSYGIYLFHVIAIWVGCIVLADAPHWLQWTVAAVTLCALSGLGYHWIEHPAIKLGARLATRRTAALQPA
ncbi:acyltransferase family protein [Peristeroidobacter soli]|jgi:peptidoglycan/LPS O-acetylase OafA/YrhL|uniref:acyltransferase family protein n=1 Tax=Peristeroidobacter soli TaxID=2497877 RepID=UPI00101D1F96|nr:acyltransferase [Peristeroidobacter soli]